LARLVRTDRAIVFTLSPIERLLAVHFAPVEMELSTLRRVEVVDDIWTRVRGVRAPFTWLKDHVMIGTRRGLFGKDFDVVYGLGRGVCVEFEGGPWARFVIKDGFPEDLAALLRG
jgi:hypothetical protein